MLTSFVIFFLSSSSFAQGQIQRVPCSIEETIFLRRAVDFQPIASGAEFRMDILHLLHDEGTCRKLSGGRTPKHLIFTEPSELYEVGNHLRRYGIRISFNSNRTNARTYVSRL